MDQLDELERRLSAALDRIGSAASGMGASGEAGMAEALEAERAANAQLEERVKAIKEKQETMIAALEAEVSQLKSALETREGEVQRMRGVNAQLRTHTSALREANKAGLADAHLINKAMAAELDALRAVQEKTRAEVDEIIGALEPMLREGPHA